MLAVALAAGVSECGVTSPRGTTEAKFDFRNGPQGWTAGFADYRAGDEARMELESDYRQLPAPLGPESAVFISGLNTSDDLFMFVWRRLDGLEPKAPYDATFEVTIATDVPFDCGGIGGLPAGSVYLKAGAAGVAPATAPDELGILRLNIDHGNQATPGANAVVMGTIGNSTSCDAGVRRWELKPFLRPGAPLSIRANDQGAVWLLVGTDSGFEGTTSLFYTRVTATLTKR
jgi:hypothetical protein